jgi:hypothetical protein
MVFIISVRKAAVLPPQMTAYKEFVFWNDQIGDEGKTMMREAWKNAGKNSGLHF